MVKDLGRALLILGLLGIALVVGLKLRGMPHYQYYVEYWEPVCKECLVGYPDDGVCASCGGSILENGVLQLRGGVDKVKFSDIFGSYEDFKGNREQVVYLSGVYLVVLSLLGGSVAYCILRGRKVE